VSAAEAVVFGRSVVTAFPNVEIGSGVCSDKEGAAFTNNVYAFEWSREYSAGSRFALTTFRGSDTRCAISALGRDANVKYVKHSGAPETNVFWVGAFDTVVVGPHRINLEMVTFITDAPVTVACWWSSTNDYIVLQPVSTLPVYGWISMIAMISNVDCNTMVPVNGPESYSCRASDDKGCVSVYTQNNATYRKYGPGQFTGPGVECSPQKDKCVSSITTADGDGFDAITFLPYCKFTTLAVIPNSVQNIALLSVGSDSVICEIKVNGVVQKTMNTHSDNDIKVASMYVSGFDVYRYVGAVIECNAPVMISVDIGNKEQNLMGLESNEQCVDSPVSTSSPSINPTKFPSSSPSISPTKFPSSSPSSSPSISPTKFPSLSSESSVFLGTAIDYTILSKSGVSTVPSSVINGDIGVSPIALTGATGFSVTLDSTGQFATSGQVTGKVVAADMGAPISALLTVAVLFMETAYTDAAGRTNYDASRINLNGGLLGVADLHGGPYAPGGPNAPLTPGVYTFTTGITMNEDIYFRGDETDVFILQSTGNVLLAADKRIHLVGGVRAENIYWQNAGNVYIMARAHMEGVLLCKTDVTLITGASLNGRILSQTAVTLQMATITA